MRPPPEMIPVLIDAAKALKGSRRRLFMAKTAQAMGRGGQRWALDHLGWCRDTIRKGTHELRSGMTCVDAFSARRRKPAEEHLPRLLDDIRDLVDGQCQADPRFPDRPALRPRQCRRGPTPIDRREGLHRRGTAHPADDQHEAQHAGLPAHQGGQVPPPKRVPQTDAIFEQVKRVNEQADSAGDTLRLSLDAKAMVNVGPFSRRGRGRTGTEAADHDFKPEATLTPFGILLPEHDDLTLYVARSKVTSDFIVDRLEDWWGSHRDRFPGVTKLVLNLDNGPENHSRR